MFEQQDYHLSNPLKFNATIVSIMHKRELTDPVTQSGVELDMPIFLFAFYTKNRCQCI